MAKEEINAFLGASTEYRGKLTFQGAVRIDGIFHGEIESEGALIAGKDAHIEGTVHVGEFILSGLFTGTIVAKKRLIIHRGGRVVGDVSTPALFVEEGAFLDGMITMQGTYQGVHTNNAPPPPHQLIALEGE